MSITAEALRELHRIHRQVTDLRSRLERGPRQVAANEANVKRLEEQHASAKQQLTATRVSSDQRQLQLREREARIKDLRAKLNAANNNREYQALREQIAADEQANSVLSDEILEALERIDELQAAVVQADGQLKKAREDLEKLRVRIAEEGQRLEGELARVTADLRQAETALPAEIRSDYERITRSRGEDAMAQVEGETCSACYQMLSPQTMNELFLSKLVFCKSCGAILYLAEGRKPQ